MKGRNSIRRFRLLAIASIATGLTVTSAAAQVPGPPWRDFQLSSTTFTNNTTLPLSAIQTNLSNGVNTCSINGAPGGNQSPELSWTGAPPNTRTFAVVLYDVTAAFTHWGMYNIPGHSSGLPQNAGVAGSSYGAQVVSDWGKFVTGGSAEYDGPCPPNMNYPPNVHTYVFTVYALKTELTLSGSANFPASADTLYHALIEAGRDGQILASASLTGLYSSYSSK